LQNIINRIDEIVFISITSLESELLHLDYEISFKDRPCLIEEATSKWKLK